MATRPSPIEPALPEELPPVFDPDPAPGEPDGLPWMDPDSDVPDGAPEEMPEG